MSSCVPARDSWPAQNPHGRTLPLPIKWDDSYPPPFGKKKGWEMEHEGGTGPGLPADPRKGWLRSSQQRTWQQARAPRTLHPQCSPTGPRLSGVPSPTPASGPWHWLSLGPERAAGAKSQLSPSAAISAQLLPPQ